MQRSRRSRRTRSRRMRGGNWFDSLFGSKPAQTQSNGGILGAAQPPAPNSVIPANPSSSMFAPAQGTQGSPTGLFSGWFGTKRGGSRRRHRRTRYRKKNWSSVVLTQNNRWRTMPNTNRPPSVTQKDHPNPHAKSPAPTTVIKTSTMATPKKRYAWTPCLGFPNASLYLQNMGFLIFFSIICPF